MPLDFTSLIPDRSDPKEAPDLERVGKAEPLDFYSLIPKDRTTKTANALKKLFDRSTETPKGSPEPKDDDLPWDVPFTGAQMREAREQRRKGDEALVGSPNGLLGIIQRGGQQLLGERPFPTPREAFEEAAVGLGLSRFVSAAQTAARAMRREPPGPRTPDSRTLDEAIAETPAGRPPEPGPWETPAAQPKTPGQSTSLNEAGLRPSEAATDTETIAVPQADGTVTQVRVGTGEQPPAGATPGARPAEAGGIPETVSQQPWTWTGPRAPEAPASLAEAGITPTGVEPPASGPVGPSPTTRITAAQVQRRDGVGHNEAVRRAAAENAAAEAAAAQQAPPAPDNLEPIGSFIDGQFTELPAGGRLGLPAPPPPRVRGKEPSPAEPPIALGGPEEPQAQTPAQEQPPATPEVPPSATANDPVRYAALRDRINTALRLIETARSLARKWDGSEPGRGIFEASQRQIQENTELLMRMRERLTPEDRADLDRLMGIEQPKNNDTQKQIAESSPGVGGGPTLVEPDPPTRWGVQTPGIGYEPGMAGDGQSAAPPVQPEAAPEVPPALAGGNVGPATMGPWTPLKPNHMGDMVYENPQGVRAIMDQGAPWVEATKDGPDGSRVPRNPDDRKKQFRTEDDAPFEGEKPKPKPEEPAPPKSEAPERPRAPEIVETPKPEQLVATQEPAAPITQKPEPETGITPTTPGPEIVEHVTGKGKTLRGVVRKDMTQAEAKAIDPYSFKKDGGWFIREAHLDKLPPLPGASAPPAPKPVPENGEDIPESAPTAQAPAAPSPESTPFTSADIGTQVRPKPGSGLNVEKNGGTISHVQGTKISVNGGPHFEGSDFERVPTPSTEAAKPEAPKPRPAAKPRPGQITNEMLAEYFTPGAIVHGYGGSKDKVVAFHPTSGDKYWSVDVREVNKDGTLGRPRNHMTMPTIREIEQARKERAGTPTEAPKPTEHPGLIIKSLETGKETTIQPPGTVAPKSEEPTDRISGTRTLPEITDQDIVKADDHLNDPEREKEVDSVYEKLLNGRSPADISNEPEINFTPHEIRALAEVMRENDLLPTAKEDDWQPALGEAAEPTGISVPLEGDILPPTSNKPKTEKPGAEPEILPRLDANDEDQRLAPVGEYGWDYLPGPYEYRVGETADKGVISRFIQVRVMNDYNDPTDWFTWRKSYSEPLDIDVESPMQHHYVRKGDEGEIEPEDVWDTHGQDISDYLAEKMKELGAPTQGPKPIPSSLGVAEQQAKKNEAEAPEPIFPTSGSEMDPLLANNMDRLREKYGKDGMMARIVAQWLHERESLPAGEDRSIKPQSVQNAAEFVYGGKLANNDFPRDRMYDAVETGVNLFIAMQPERFAPTGDLARAKEQAAELAEIKSWLPTQTVRAGDKVKLQQFSTPPDYAFAAAWAANIQPGEVAIEPSAGTGGIAVHAMNAGAKVVGNEISPQRRAMMETLPFDRITKENAEQLHNILPRDIKPTVVVMNPPFSSAGDRMGGKMVLETGAVHIEQALKRLEPGGRLVAIVGDGMKPYGAETAGKGGRNNATGAAFRDWWKKIGAEYDVRANIGVGGEIYRKYGTTFPTRLLVIDKVAPSGEPPMVTTALTSAELLDALQGVRDARPGSAGQQVADQSGGPGMAPQGQGAGGSPGAIRPPTGGVGAGGEQNQPTQTNSPKPTGSGGGQGSGIRPGSGARPGGSIRGNAPPVQQPKPDAPGGTGQPVQQPVAGEKPGGSGAVGDTGHTRPDGSDLSVTPPAPELLETSIVTPEEQTGGELSDSVYENYKPQRVTIEGAQPHPSPLVQSAAMASVLPPLVTYRPNIPKSLIESGALSAAQLEAITYAGAAHQQMLPGDGKTTYKIGDRVDIMGGGVITGKRYGTGKQIDETIWTVKFDDGKTVDGTMVGLKLPAAGARRRGYFIGDGTGVGKGATIAGIILDNKWQGRKKALWISQKFDLAKDAKRDWAWVGQNIDGILTQNKVDAGGEIKHEGILFTTYDTVKSGEKFGGATDAEWEAHGKQGFFDGAKVTANHPLTGQTAEMTIVGNKPSKDTRTELEWKVKDKNDKIFNVGQWMLTPQQVGIERPKTAEPKTRIQQIVDWVGKDFDGVIAFDEAHSMANAVGEQTDRGAKDASMRALAGLELQNALPNARVVYVSATGATEVNNLAYADRLGLWGPGTAFANRGDFLSRVSQGGVAAMELVARDMKALGYYTARSLSYDGVEYDRVQHDLNPNQRVMYDKIAEGWQIVLANMMQALADTGADGKGGPKGVILSAFWGGHQRFFNQLITSLQMPSVIAGVDKDIAEGRQAVLQLVNTNEAGQKRALMKSKARGDEDLEELDMSPKDQLMQLIDKAFPTQQYEEYTDENDVVRVRPVVDSEGNRVENPEAVAAKARLMLDMGSLDVPDGPLEILMDHYGPDAVAEVTGRKERVVRRADEAGKMKKVKEKRGAGANIGEANSFQSGKKKILVFSQAGGTGSSYHDDKTADRVDDTGRLGIGGNGARRSHYLVQAGWKADTAVQGFGRTHRTNQWTAPIFHLVTTDLEGQKRFISSIARRLGQLGALTKGERRTGDQGMFGLQDNLESDEAKAGLVQLFRDIYAGNVEGFSVEDLSEQMGLNIVGENGQLRDDLPPMTQFLNRVLSLKVNDQNRVFNEFATRFRDIIDLAAANGTLDAGTETYKADKIVKASDQVVFTDPNSGAETRHVHLKTYNRNYPVPFNDIMSGKSNMTGWQAPEFFVKNKRTGNISAVAPTTYRKVHANGQITDFWRVATPTSWEYVPKDEVADSTNPKTGNMDRITNIGDARTLWDERIAKTPEFRESDLHLITGAILPIWDRLAGHPKIFRLMTDGGEKMLGRVVDNKMINETLKKLGAEGVKLDVKPAVVVDRILDGAKADLANGWSIKRRRVANEWRLELTGTDLYSHTAELEAMGVFREQIPGTYETRYFIPTGTKGAGAIEAITKRRPIISLED